jgi:ubiquinone/menaquinone biosynthesis C-methylase UbiE
MSPHGQWHYFSETERRKWQNPDTILAEIGLKTGATFMDIGCGEGFFTIPAARLVGLSGKVFGLDTNANAIEDLRRKASAEGLNNIELKVGAAEEILLCQDCADMIFLGTVLHDFQNPSQVLKIVRQMIKPEGKLVNLDWKKTAMNMGPPPAIRFDEATASRLIESAGFKVTTVKDSGPYHYIIVAAPR